MRATCPLATCLALACLLVSACDDPFARNLRRIGRDPVVLSPSERLAVDRLTRDAWVDLEWVERRSDGHLLVGTRSGEHRQRFLLTREAGDETGDEGERILAHLLPRRSLVNRPPVNLSADTGEGVPPYLASPVTGAAPAP